jgi:hypothetical protein
VHSAKALLLTANYVQQGVSPTSRTFPKPGTLASLTKASVSVQVLYVASKATSGKHSQSNWRNTATAWCTQQLAPFMTMIKRVAQQMTSQGILYQRGANTSMCDNWLHLQLS